MKVVPFVPRRSVEAGPWQSAELEQIVAACATSIAQGEVSGWETGATETGDPQVYLLGPAPDHDCILCVSRFGRLYILEDGNGRILLEHDALGILTEQVRAMVQRRKSALALKVLAAWLAIKETFEERIEPALAEPVEVLSHVAPQLAALA
jgi:hypothetical protein